MAPPPADVIRSITVPDPRLTAILDRLRASRFAELQGTVVSASIPLTERLVTELVAAALPPTLPIRDVTIRARGNNRFTVSARLAQADFLPAISVTLEIESQPRLPDAPLVLRILSLPGIFSMAGPFLSRMATLPPGIELREQRVYVDVRMLLERSGFGELVPLLEDVRVAVEPGRLQLDVVARVR